MEAINETKANGSAEHEREDEHRPRGLDAVDLFYEARAGAVWGMVTCDQRIERLGATDGRTGAVAYAVEVSGASREDVAGALIAGLDAVVTALDGSERPEWTRHAVEYYLPTLRAAREVVDGADPDETYARHGGPESEGMIELLGYLYDLAHHEDDPPAWICAHEVALAIADYHAESLDVFLAAVVVALARGHVRGAGAR